MIEILKTEDLASYKELIDECFGASNDISIYQKYHENPNYKIFVIKEDGKVAGSITQYVIDLFTFDFQPSLMLFNVAVKPEYRKNKIAKKLLEYIIENAKAEGYNSISINCLGQAHSAHKLYESFGFVKADSVKYDLSLR